MKRLPLLLLSLASPVLALPPENWSRLPDLPDPVGFAAPFAGIHDDRLIVAGGANFPGQMPWEGGAKVWHDSVFVLDHPSARWRLLGKLPRRAAYGVSISTTEGLICIGGSDAARHHDQVFRLTLDGDTIRVHDLPPLPQPCANLSGALLGRLIVVAGGIDKPDAVEALRAVWALDLDAPDRGWRSLDPLPAPGRMLAAAGARDGALFLVGGAALKPGPDGKPVRQWLRDSLRLTPGKSWQRLADAPGVSVAAPTPMPSPGPDQLLLLGGDDGSQVSTPPAAHPGFPRALFAYHTRTDTWTPAGTLPIGLVTTSALLWRGRLVIPGGEVRPGVRSPQIWTVPFPPGQESSSPGQKTTPP